MSTKYVVSDRANAVGKIDARSHRPFYESNFEWGYINGKIFELPSGLDSEENPIIREITAKVAYHTCGAILAEVWENAFGRRHREGDQPAAIAYDENGNIIRQEWYINGYTHREGDNPAVIIYDKDGNIIRQEWCVNSNLHREKGPALIDNGKEYYYKNGRSFTPKAVTVESVLAKLQDLLADVAELKKQ